MKTILLAAIASFTLISCSDKNNLETGGSTFPDEYKDNTYFAGEMHNALLDCFIQKVNATQGEFSSWEQLDPIWAACTREVLGEEIAMEISEMSDMIDDFEMEELEEMIGKNVYADFNKEEMTPQDSTWYAQAESDYQRLIDEEIDHDQHIALTKELIDEISAHDDLSEDATVLLQFQGFMIKNTEYWTQAADDSTLFQAFSKIKISE